VKVFRRGHDVIAGRNTYSVHSDKAFVRCQSHVSSMIRRCNVDRFSVGKSALRLRFRKILSGNSKNQRQHDDHRCLGTHIRHSLSCDHSSPKIVLREHAGTSERRDRITASCRRLFAFEQRMSNCGLTSTIALRRRQGSGIRSLGAPVRPTGKTPGRWQRSARSGRAIGFPFKGCSPGDLRGAARGLACTRLAPPNGSHIQPIIPHQFSRFRFPSLAACNWFSLS
jgi:hypothetical protein